MLIGHSGSKKDVPDLDPDSVCVSLFYGKEFRDIDCKLAFRFYFIASFLNTNSVLYSLWDGRPLTTIDTSFLDISPESIQTWQLSDDLGVLVLVSQSGDLVHVDLKKFAPGWSGSVQRDRNGSVLVKDQTKAAQASGSSLHTCRTVDPAWREKLLSLHQGSTIKTNSQLHKMERKQGTSDKRKTEKRSKVTGFKSKDQRKSGIAENAQTHLEAPRELQGYSVEGVSIGSSTLILVYTYNDVSALCSYNVQNDSWTLQRLVTV